MLSEIYDFTANNRRKLLVVEPDGARMKQIRDYLGGLEDVEIVGMSDGAKAAEMIRAASVDCAVVNPETPELELATLMEEMRDMELAPPPVIAFGRQAAPRAEAAE